ncbi:MAG TPA: Smr/MutS family protein, partial [Gammaproteobacteria bacterium]|nr:Smr/MutS family protein [Gammaproteobacteria bacterium]
ETPEKPPVKIRKKIIETEYTSPLSDFESLDPVSASDLLFFARPGIQYKILRKLREGQYNAEAILDLHGMTVEESRTALYHFIIQCRQKGVRHALVIHGKGRANCKPILKNKLNHWLRQIPEVLAFSSAHAKDGATGALYVLLRR